MVINYVRLIITIIFALIIGVLMWAAFHYYGKTISQQSEISVANQAKNQAEFITKSQALTTGIFNTIAEVNINAKQGMQSDGEAQVIYITNAIKGDACADKPVPSAAADSLRKYADKIRANSTYATPGKPAG
ncbi:hypothetical protein [Hafnia psychrotolerans]|uniref:Lysozyme n=1 Tax=Hafnia psychrotolerans TaxID=1477018 RepID=A0ABQ1G0S8_9GAMM|nr:hypothetical protein [Hafnia psychrotolerans]GGA33844.1 lysozyme [Hafnia psychrotolerans]